MTFGNKMHSVTPIGCTQNSIGTLKKFSKVIEFYSLIGRRWLQIFQLNISQHLHYWKEFLHYFLSCHLTALLLHLV